MKELKEEWQEVRLGDVVHFNPTEKLIKGNNYKKVPMDCLIPKTRKIENYEVNTFNGGSKFRNGDTLMARITPCLENGKTAQVSILEENEIAFGSTEFIVLREKENISNNNFIYYLFNTDYIRSTAIKSMTGTSGRQRVQEDVLKNTIIKLPSLEEQKKMASILSSLDDKIELNNRMNKILEETAQTIFKEWFINFNFPNEEGKPYKKSGGKMIESELGEIPEGWEVITLENILKVIKGKKTKETHIKKTDLLNYQYLTIDCYNNSNIEYTEYVEKMYVDKLDIIMVMDGASSGKLFYGKNGILSSTMAKFYVENKNINEIVFFFLKKIENEIMYHTTGSAIPHANKQFILNKKIALPPKQLLNLTNYIKTIREKIINNIEENQKLAGIRDSILPKLMSGEIRIK